MHRDVQHGRLIFWIDRMDETIIRFTTDKADPDYDWIALPEPVIGLASTRHWGLLIETTGMLCSLIGEDPDEFVIRKIG
jgi:hypothetical protein